MRKRHFSWGHVASDAGKNKLRTLGQPQSSNGIEVLEHAGVAGFARDVLSKGGSGAGGGALQQLALQCPGARRGSTCRSSATTPYQNTIPSRQQPPFPGSQEHERRIKSLVRWNAMAMRRPRQQASGRHRRTHFDVCVERHALEVAFNHFFRRPLNRATAISSISQGHRRTWHLCPRLP